METEQTTKRMGKDVGTMLTAITSKVCSKTGKNSEKENSYERMGIFTMVIGLQTKSMEWGQ